MFEGFPIFSSMETSNGGRGGGDYQTLLHTLGLVVSEKTIF